MDFKEILIKLADVRLCLERTYDMDDGWFVVRELKAVECVLKTMSTPTLTPSEITAPSPVSSPACHIVSHHNLPDVHQQINVLLMQGWRMRGNLMIVKGQFFQVMERP